MTDTYWAKVRYRKRTMPKRTTPFIRVITIMNVNTIERETLAYGTIHEKKINGPCKDNDSSSSTYHILPCFWPYLMILS